jgi:hypothetical protein
MGDGRKLAVVHRFYRGNMTTVQLDQALADQMIEKAVASCADKKFRGETESALQALRQGRCDICGYVAGSLVQQIGQYLGQMDRTVKAVYAYEPERGSLRPEIGRQAARRGINLIAWVERKSAALGALAATLETVLAERRRRFGCKNATAACFVLDVEMVDDKDVLDRRGYGVLVNSLYVRSSQVWSRGEEVATLNIETAVSPAVMTAFDPELAPEHLLFAQAHAIEKLPEAERAALDYRLSELKVALIRKIISDQLAYITIAKEWLTFEDLENIHRRKIGFGKIGGKAAGMILAARILKEVADPDLQAHLRVPESYFLGSDVMYIFMAMNGLMRWNDQKYKPEDQIRAEYAQIREEFQAGQFPPEVLDRLQALLAQIGPHPVIVRSSSQLEDNFGTSFAGKYDSHFCPNQGAPEENLAALTNAIARTYASTYKPDALLYRRAKGLQDYDERMACLIQVVQGETFGRYFLPHGAGVAFSRNLYRWAPQIRREDGFARLVWGLGTRAVERVGNDYPRLVALSHPTLQPDDSAEVIQRYSQQYVDLIDLEANEFKTLSVRDVLTPSYPTLRYMAQRVEEGYLATLRGRVSTDDIPQLAITFDELLRRTPFAGRMAKMLRLLEEHYQAAVDMEFTITVPDAFALKPEAVISLLQCRPQSHLQAGKVVRVPRHLPHNDIVFSTGFMVPQGYVPNIRYVLFVTPEDYYAFPTEADRKALARTISALNAALPPKSFICVGPGRWGTTNTDLGVFVGYADICNAGALVEISGKGIGPAPEPSLGTHFFQDLMEAQIYPVAIPLDAEGTIFNREFFYQTPNRLFEWVKPEGCQGDCLRLIAVADFRPGCHLDLVMDDDQGQGVAYLAADE